MTRPSDPPEDSALPGQSVSLSAAVSRRRQCEAIVAPSSPLRGQTPEGAAAVAASAGRLAFVDLLRALGSQLIVWHHLAFYGPLSDLARPLAPLTIGWVGDQARMAVQIFFVLGGFVAARGLERQFGARPPDWARHLLRRFLRIGAPYGVAIAVAVGANELARTWMTHRSISAPATPGQLLAHAFFRQDLLGYEALSAGIWYVAIDWQLTLLAALVLVIGMAARRAGLAGWPGGVGPEPAVFWALGVLSLYWWNRHRELDIWAVYFVGSWVAGMVVRYALGRRIPSWQCLGYLGFTVLATTLDDRPRLLVAATVAGLLCAAGRFGWMGWPRSRLVENLGRISYSLFLIHFPVCLAVNAWWSSHVPATPGLALTGMLVAYGLSLWAATLLYRFVEAPALGALGGR
jgi:peptidoglycan/LPS O-acetylase OafA/YrhL